MKKLIYIAEDEPDIRNLVALYLENEGYTVHTFSNGDDLFNAFQKKKADLVVLDIMMPGTDGLTICKNLRGMSTVPIIILTAKDTDADFVAGMTYGSDDYLIKPFSPTQLNMRIKAIFRRVEMSREETETPVSTINCGELTYKESERSIFCGGQDLALTETELALLRYLMIRFNEVISREELLQKIWGINSEVETRVTDETIRRVRKKMRQVGCTMQIKNKWGYGYSLKDGANNE